MMTANVATLLWHLLFFLATCHSFVVQPRSTVGIKSSSLASSSPEDVATELREQAEKLRQQVESFQQEKEAIVKAKQQQQEQALREKQDIRNRYSAEVPIRKGDGSTVVERVDFPPRYPQGTSRILSCEAALPLDIILGESTDMPGLTVVDELGENGNGALAGIQVGDIVRACTACQAVMKAPTWQILAGGIGMPETCRFMHNIDGRPFEEVMQAIGSNRMDPQQRPVVLVLERQG
jgi:hypothetical protein